MTPPANHVLVRVSGVPNSNEVAMYIGRQIRALPEGASKTWQSNGPKGPVLEITVWPVNDPNSFARSIDFGTVKSVKGKTIEVEAHPGLAASIPKKSDLVTDRAAVTKHALPAPPPPRPTDPAGLRKVLLEEMKSSNPHTRRTAAQELVKMKPDDQRAEVSKELCTLLADDSSVEDVLVVLRTWGTQDCVPAVIRVMRTTRWPTARSKAMAVLANFPSEESAAAVAESMDITNSAEASAILAEMGPAVAEKAVARVLPNLDGFALRDGLKLLKRLCGSKTPEPETVDALLNILRKESSSWALEDAIGIVGKVKEPRVAEVLASGLADGRYRTNVGRTLIEMGSVAERPVLEYLKHSDPNTRAAACEVLAAVGTRRSVNALQPLVRDFFMGRTARQAIDAIENRLKSNKKD